MEPTQTVPARESGRRRTLRCLVLQHVWCEPPGFFEDELLSGWGDLDRVQLGEGERMPSWRGYDGVVVMGGPMGALDDADHSWLAPERRLIAECVRAGVPFWGVCLGAQLLAAALGAPVMRGPRSEVGVDEVTVTDAGDADPVFGGLPRTFDSLHWHDDTFELPEGSVHLASSRQYANQAFRWKNAWGLQFHLEVDGRLARQWLELPEYRASARRVLGPRAARLPDQVGALEAGNSRIARALFARWLRVCADLAGRSR